MVLSEVSPVNVLRIVGVCGLVVVTHRGAIEDSMVLLRSIDPWLR